MCDSPYAAIEGADAVAIVTEWDAFRALDFDRVKQLARAPVLVDLRNIYRPDAMAALGFSYISVGRPQQVETLKRRKTALTRPLCDTNPQPCAISTLVATAA